MILPTMNERDGYADVRVAVEARVISADTAVRKASAFLAMNVGHLLRAENPELVFDESRLRWRLDVVLTSPSSHVVEMIDTIFVSATDGEILNSKDVVAAFHVSAH